MTQNLQRRSRAGARRQARHAVDTAAIARAGVSLAAAVIDYFGTGPIAKELEGDIALRSAAYRILATAADSE